MSDAQYVVAREQGYRSWAELKGSREETVVAEEGMNVNRRGVVCVGVRRRRDIDTLTRRLAETSLAVYVALLELS